MFEITYNWKHWSDLNMIFFTGTEGGIRLYIEELVEITKIGLESNSWPMKAQAASAMETIGGCNRPNFYLNIHKSLVGVIDSRYENFKNLCYFEEIVVYILMW